MCITGTHKEVIAFQFDTLRKTLKNYMKEHDIEMGTFAERGMYSVYLADWQYLRCVWVPKVSNQC